MSRYVLLETNRKVGIGPNAANGYNIWNTHKYSLFIKTLVANYEDDWVSPRFTLLSVYDKHYNWAMYEQVCPY